MEKLNELSEEEQVLIQLFRECESVDFYKYRSTFSESESFVSKLDTPLLRSGENSTWLGAEKGKIKVTSFMKKEEAK